SPAETWLGIGKDMREARGDRAQVEALRPARVERRLIQGRVLHCGVVEGVAELPAGHVLQVRRPRNGRGGPRRVRKIYHPCSYVEGSQVGGELHARAEDVHPPHIAATDDRVERVTRRIDQS